jgi:rubredoxin
MATGDQYYYCEKCNHRYNLAGCPIHGQAPAKPFTTAKDNFVAVYLAEHPKLSIDDIELVEEQMPVAEGYLGMKCRWYCRPKESEDSLR